MEKNEDALLDPMFPSSEEQNLIAQGVFISKLKYNAQNIQPSYHRWRDVWDEKLLFAVAGLNQDLVWRAMAISMPMYFLDDPNVIELNHRAYVYGVVMGDSGVRGQPFELSRIIWKK